MKELSTRQKIVTTSVNLFNKKGFGHVTLRDIAGDLQISTGNLTYHFRNKDFILEEAFHQMELEREELLSAVQAIPSFENIDRHLIALVQLARKYEFLYLDTFDILRNYPNLATLHREHIEGHINYIRAMLDYSVGTGNLEKEQVRGSYQRLAVTVWMVIFFWLMQERVRGISNKDNSELRRTMWNLVIPHLTTQGKHNFNKHILSFQNNTIS